jgi:hypothetical protein
VCGKGYTPLADADTGDEAKRPEYEPSHLKSCDVISDLLSNSQNSHPQKDENLTMDSIRIKTAKSFIDAYSGLRVEDFLPLLADDYSHSFAPASAERLTTKNKTEIAELISALHGVMRGFSVSIKEAIDSESSNKVVIWATSEALFREEAKDAGAPEEAWKYTGEYVLIFTTDDSGERITRLVEFVDTKGTDRMMELVVRAMKNMEERKKDET